MKCKNRYCRFEQDGKCIFESITVDKNGQCMMCDNIKPSEEEMREVKSKIREELTAQRKRYF